MNNHNQKAAEMLGQAIRHIYNALPEYSDVELKQKITLFLNKYIKVAKAKRMNLPIIVGHLKIQYGLSSAVISRLTQAMLPNIPKALPNPNVNKPAQTEEHGETQSQESNSVVHALGYDSQLAAMLLTDQEQELTPAQQRTAMASRVTKAKQAVEQQGYDFIKIMENLDLILHSRNDAFLQSLNQSYYTIVHHLNPRQANKMRVPITADVGKNKWFDFGRVRRLIEYIQCGRMARDTSKDFDKRLDMEILRYKK